MKVVEVIIARGHENIRATNETTFEITKDTFLTKRGDCIIAVAADKSGKDLGEKFKRILKKPSSKLTVVIQVGGQKEIVEAWGDPKLSLNHSTDLVVRKSNYVCDRTLGIRADKAAKNLSRLLVARLKNSQQEVEITLTVEDSS